MNLEMEKSGAPVFARLAADRHALAAMRRAAQDKARGSRWDEVARRTVGLYERVLAERPHAR